LRSSSPGGCAIGCTVAMRKVIHILLHASKSYVGRIEAAHGTLVKLASRLRNRPFALKLKALSRRFFPAAKTARPRKLRTKAGRI
jgi:hypothetical protein